ncbi:uncharacterized protein LOC123314308 [Coccinella septempunctata]|uniref:uncharacterized protein LOC123314308 n=1 Tax=Coccinella septempunctata TaxID=41139 RepID=UPI001D0685BC|nr:uncharacterized protein LOC123314308 [Coccinella septempunctata]
MSKEYVPIAPSEVPEKELKLEFDDPRSYCYNVVSKTGNVCIPKSCGVVKVGQQKLKDENEETVIDKEPTKLIPFKQEVKSCIPASGKDEPRSGVQGETVRDELGGIAQGNVNLGITGFGSTSSTNRTPGMGPPGMGAPGVADSLGIMGIGGQPGAVMGAVPSSEKDRETVSLARLVGIAQGPAAIMASFGDTETAKESLASLGALSMGGAIVCECCECDPCVCGPRGLNIENIVAALKAMMSSGEDLNKLIAALGPGAMAALETIMGKESEAAAEWAAGTAGTKPEPEAPRRPAESPSQIALREAWMRGDFDEMTSCHCLPGMCPCPGGHYVLKAKKTADKKDKGKKKKKIRKKVKKIGKDGKEYEEWDWATPSDSDLVSRLSETCVCPPTKHFLTPATSDAEVSDRLAVPSKRIYWGDLMVCTCPRLQRTLAIIKPETTKFKDVVLRAIKNYGLDLLSERYVQLSPEEASEIYAKYYGTSKFPNMVVSISQAPIIVLSLGGIDVVKIWNHMIGPDGTLPGEWFLPDWISRKFGHTGDIVDALHGSKNLFSAENENRYFFTENYIDPIMKNETDVKGYIKQNVNPTLLKGLTLLAKKRPVDPVIFLAEWLLTHNPFQPHFPANISLSPI